MSPSGGGESRLPLLHLPFPSSLWGIHCLGPCPHLSISPRTPRPCSAGHWGSYDAVAPTLTCRPRCSPSILTASSRPPASSSPSYGPGARAGSLLSQDKPTPVPEL